MNLFEMAGAPPQNREKDSPFRAIYTARFFNGLFTQRNIMLDSSSVVESKFYGGRMGVLWDTGFGDLSKNIELTNELQLQRRFGLSQFSSATYPTPPLGAFSFPTGGSPEIQVIVDTSDEVYIDNQNGTKTSLWSKSVGAGATRFVAIDGVLYAGDGVSTWKYVFGNPNANPPVFNFGIAAPTAPPSVVITEEADAGIAWTASTVFSTMGLVLDNNGNVEFLNSVNLLGNTGQFGTTGQGSPNFSTVYGTTTTETSGTPITWTSRGQITQWKANTVYQGGQAIYVPATGCIYLNTTGDSGSSGTTGGNEPAFTATLGQTIVESTGIRWTNYGTVGGTYIKLWQPSFEYSTFNGAGPTPGELMLAVWPVLPTSANTQATITAPNQPVYLQTANAGGESGNGYQPPWATTAGLLTSDNELSWTCLGSSVWAADTAYTPWSAGASVFSVVKDSAGTPNFWVCTAITGSGLSGGSITFPSSPNYGDTFTDNQVTWTCVGPKVGWVKDTKWYLPANGFSAPTSDQAYGGAAISVSVTSGTYSFFVVKSGLSGASEPTFTAEVDFTTTDNDATWLCVGEFSQFSLSWSTGHVYAFSYKARESDDPYVTTSLLTYAGLNTQQAILPLVGNVPGLSAPLGTYLGSGTGGISTASPVFTITGSNNGAVNTISGPYSPDPQVDTIVLWRDADGGGEDNMFELVEIPNIPSLAGISNWSFNDFLPDIASTVDTVVFPGLDDQSQAPVNSVGQNNPPPSTFLPQNYNFARTWGIDEFGGNTVLFSGGPDVLVGNPNECFLASDEFPFLSAVTRLVRTNQGNIVFTNSDIEIIAGGPSTESFYSVQLAAGIGLLTYNALDVYAGNIFMFTADGQFFSIGSSVSIANLGFAIGNLLEQMNASNVWVSVLQNGTDNAVFVSDGETGWFRLNPNQIPGMVGSGEPQWSPWADITNGLSMMVACEISPGITKLLVGSSSDNQSIAMRDTSVFTDLGTEYDAYWTMGSLVLCPPGNLAILSHLTMEFTGYQADNFTTGYLLDEVAIGVSDGFTDFTSYVYDPPGVYGVTSSPTSYTPARYQFASTGELARTRHMLIHCDYGTTPDADAIYSLSLFGCFITE